jgi:asparagine synthase (glutamine-hydrolysing)
MSGIVGIINLDGSPVDRLLLGRMTDYLTGRGPDAQETWSQGPVGLGHALLRTVDDTRPDSQPLTLDGQVWIVADARVDGRVELRSKLRNHGCHDLEEATDAELILQSYLVWGESCVQHLIGDFAFAIWDEPQQRLFGARDHFGVKPFFYAREGNCLAFSNTLNCLRMHPEVSDKLNDLAIADFLLFGYNQDPATSAFADINRVPRAHCLTLKDGALQVKRYWTLPQESLLRYARQQDYVDHFTVLLTQAVADRLRTRDVGVFLSGGLDSSMVAALAKDLLSTQSTPYDLRAYTVVYDWLIPDAERHFAGMVADHLDIPIDFLPADTYRLYGGGEQGETRQSEPSHEPLEEISLDLVRRASAKSRVILDGEGGDEILCQSKAYVYRLVKELRFGRLALETARSVFLYGMFPQIGFRSGLKRWLTKTPKSSPMPVWLNPALVARLDLKARWEEFRKPMAYDHVVRPEAARSLLTPLWQVVLEKSCDSGELGYPVEIRHPLIDLRLINYALTVPPLPWCVNKLLLRQAGHAKLPPVITCRGKSPMAADTVSAFLRKPGQEKLDSYTPVETLGCYVDKSAIPPITGAHDTNEGWMNLVPLSLNNWLRNLKPVYQDSQTN